ncbi:MAG: hypothetical protein PHI12_11200 [Dehalococcoidales bacterium]|nr:hypothetical protein [Dehalococcoidales bacterium]
MKWYKAFILTPGIKISRPMIVQKDVSGIMSEALRWAKQKGVGARELVPAENEKVALTINRILKYSYPQREVRDLFEDHLGEIVAAACVAKEQMNGQNIDGEMPEPGKIGGPIPIRAGYLGLGDDWTDIIGITGGTPYFTPGEADNWIHSGTTLLGGSAGNAVKIGKNAVHLVLGIGSLHEAPKLEAVKFEYNAAERPALYTGWSFEHPRGVALKELEKPLMLVHGDTLKAQIFFSSAYANTVTQIVDYPQLIGVSFIKEAQLRLLDPADLDGTVQDVILTT